MIEPEEITIDISTQGKELRCWVIYMYKTEIGIHEKFKTVGTDRWQSKSNMTWIRYCDLDKLSYAISRIQKLNLLK